MMSMKGESLTKYLESLRLLEIHKFLEGLSICDIDGLACLTDADLDQIEVSLKPIQKNNFKRLFRPKVVDMRQQSEDMLNDAKLHRASIVSNDSSSSHINQSFRDICRNLGAILRSNNGSALDKQKLDMIIECINDQLCEIEDEDDTLYKKLLGLQCFYKDLKDQLEVSRHRGSKKRHRKAMPVSFNLINDYFDDPKDKKGFKHEEDIVMSNEQKLNEKQRLAAVDEESQRRERSEDYWTCTMCKRQNELTKYDVYQCAVCSTPRPYYYQYTALKYVTNATIYSSSSNNNTKKMTEHEYQPSHHDTNNHLKKNPSLHHNKDGSCVHPATEHRPLKSSMASSSKDTKNSSQGNVAKLVVPQRASSADTANRRRNMSNSESTYNIILHMPSCTDTQAKTYADATKQGMAMTAKTQNQRMSSPAPGMRNENRDMHDPSHSNVVQHHDSSDDMKMDIVDPSSSIMVLHHDSSDDSMYFDDATPASESKTMTSMAEDSHTSPAAIATHGHIDPSPFNRKNNAMKDTETSYPYDASHNNAMQASSNRMLARPRAASTGCTPRVQPVDQSSHDSITRHRGNLFIPEKRDHVVIENPVYMNITRNNDHAANQREELPFTGQAPREHVSHTCPKQHGIISNHVGGLVESTSSYATDTGNMMRADDYSYSRKMNYSGARNSSTIMATRTPQEDRRQVPANDFFVVPANTYPGSTSTQPVFASYPARNDGYYGNNSTVSSTCNCSRCNYNRALELQYNADSSRPNRYGMYQDGEYPNTFQIQSMTRAHSPPTQSISIVDSMYRAYNAVSSGFSSVISPKPYRPSPSRPRHNSIANRPDWRL